MCVDCRCMYGSVGICRYVSAGPRRAGGQMEMRMRMRMNISKMKHEMKMVMEVKMRM